MSLIPTSLFIQAAPLPATFRGTPNDFLAAMVKRMKILSPNGTNFIFIGDTEPTSNVGPWLKNGTQWWVWDDSIKRYVPLDISASFTIPFFIGTTTPGTSTPPVWLRTTKDATDIAPNDFGSAVGWYLFDGTNWVAFNSEPPSGPTSSRPASPVDYQQFFDTTINCLIWWERASWRTVSGVPGDIKQVAFEVLTDALNSNPGWALFGAGNVDFRGRVLSQATKDPGATPETNLTVGLGITPRAAFETFQQDKLYVAGTLVFPGEIALWTLVKT
jgi:hypothetical protein